MSGRMSGFVNVFRTDNLLLCGPIYEQENKAIETGRMVKGYLITIPISFDILEEEKNEK